MRILIFEWLCGGGLLDEKKKPDPACPILAQGRAMLTAVAEDFAAAGHKPVVPLDSRLTNPLAALSKHQTIPLNASHEIQRCLVEAAGNADAILVIAPESEGILVRCLKWLDPFSAKLVSPDLPFAQLTSDKLATTKHLRKKGFAQHPETELLSEITNVESKPYERFVIKPRLGAGSEEVRVVETKDLLESLARDVLSGSDWVLEPFFVGTPVSVSVIAGPESNYLCSPTIQVFETQPIGNYKEAQFPISQQISNRARRLATKVLKALPPTNGYFGMDMVIGDHEDPGTDRLIEINPRLTMSYLKLRSIEPINLAAQMIEPISTR